ncbi:MAG: glycerophosphodiester phosphodiesterase family protein [Clostridia bacterium]|nr:glycerophosphodiester phosphodiesterase family protein [Clostridia bacterium]
MAEEKHIKSMNIRRIILTAALCALAVLLTALISSCGRSHFNVSEVMIAGSPLSARRVSVKMEAENEARRSAKSADFFVFVNRLLTEAGGTPLTKESDGSDTAAPGLIFTEDRAAYGFDDYTVRLEDSCGIRFEGGSAWALKMAWGAFFETYVLSGKGIDESGAEAAGNGGVLIRYAAPNRETYISDPSLLPIHWKGEWQPPAAMLDYKNKVDCIERKNKRHVFTTSHRGDWLHYPENSIEAIISVWAMGGDCVEIDVRVTKDKVPVILHDTTLSRTTDFAEKAGKNGLPESDKIGDWTLEELRQLRLKEGEGGQGAEVTPYVIPTLEECLIAARGRFFYILDKQKAWRYAELPEIEEIQPLSKKRDLAPVMESADNFESVFIAYGTIDDTEEGTLDADEALRIQQFIYDTYGRKMYFFLRGWTELGTASKYAETLEKGSLTNSGVIVNGAFVAGDKETNKTIKALTKAHPDTFFGAWTIDRDGSDVEEVWKMMYDTGLRGMMSNDMLRLVKFAAKAGHYA